MTIAIGRRRFVAILGSVAAAWPLTARAQRIKRPTIGLLGGATPSAQAHWTAAFVRRLGELDWVEGRTIDIEYRWAEGRFERSPAIINEFVRLNVDVIVTHATANVLAAKRGTSTIPIVFASAADPVGNGLVGSLARPGGNVTGLSSEGSDLSQKMVELIRELLPTISRVAILSRSDNPIIKQQSDAVRAAAAQFGFMVDVVEISEAKDIMPAIEALENRTGALIVPSDPLYNANRSHINDSALKARLPTLYFDRVYVEAGGLMSYGPSWLSIWRRSADFVDKILRGTKPTEIPVERPMKLELVINLTVAKALGLTLPRMIMARADALIE
jgi:putative ABC transport system substrate-binding protein